MKCVFVILMFVFTLCGCSHNIEPIDKAMDLRELVISSNGISFESVITADYEDVIYTFQLDCMENTAGNLSFVVTDPVSISGITGMISDDQPSLTFDDQVLAFPPLADGQLSPVIAPYLFLKSLRSGYLSGCGKEGEGYCIYIYDSFQNNQLHLQVFTDADCIPLRAEITYRNLRILTVDICNFTFL